MVNFKDDSFFNFKSKSENKEELKKPKLDFNKFLKSKLLTTSIILGILIILPFASVSITGAAVASINDSYTQKLVKNVSLCEKTKEEYFNKYTQAQADIIKYKAEIKAYESILNKSEEDYKKCLEDSKEITRCLSNLSLKDYEIKVCNENLNNCLDQLSEISWANELLNKVNIMCKTDNSKDAIKCLNSIVNDDDKLKVIENIDNISKKIDIILTLIS